MKIKTIFLFILLISLSVFAQSVQNDSGAGGHSTVTETQNKTIPVDIGCKPGYVDIINVRALDSQLRPVEGARVFVNYQLDKSTSKGFVNTATKNTSKDGNISFTIRNLETVEANLDCKVNVNLSVDGKNFTKSFDAGAHPTFIDFKLDLYRLVVQIVDEKNSAIKGAKITVNGVDKIAENGFIEFRVSPGETRIFATYQGGKTEHSLKVENDSLATLQINFYSLRIAVTDEAENPLGATVILNDEEYELDERGILNIERMPEGLHTGIITYKGQEVVRDLDLGENSEYSVSFDIRPPIIRNVEVTESDGQIKLTIIAQDEGRFASGESVDSIRVRYETERGKREDAVVYQSRPHEYVAVIPTTPTTNEILFVAEVKDAAGNGATIEGSHRIGENAPVINTTNSTASNENTSTTPPVEEPKPPSITDGLPLFHIIGGIIILVIVFYAVYRLKFKKDES